MKKNIIIFALVAVAALVSAFVLVKTTNTDELLRLNVEAIAVVDVEHEGRCQEQVNMCMGYCPICGQLIIAEGHAGPAYKIIEKPVIEDPNL